MNFAEIYLDRLSLKRTANMDPDPLLLIPNQYSYESLPLSEEAQAAFMHIAAGGSLHLKNSFSFSFQPFDFYMLLYTENGSGRLSYAGTTASLNAGQLLVFDCRQRFTLQSISQPWSLKLFFLTGTPLALFGTWLVAKKAPLFLLPDYSPIHKYMIQLLGIAADVTLPQFLLMQQLLNDIFTTLYLSVHQKEEEKLADIPSYIIEMKDLLDHHYQEDFSLDECQNRYNVSKYRLCREFSKHFKEPPLHYRNHRRLDAAKEMLLTTELNIHEISSMVGFENVNHFINLFKQYTGYTPNAFKQKALAGQSALHSPVQ